MIRNTVITLALCLQSQWAAAGIDWFKDESGKTNWQHLANWSSGTLIIILSITAVYLLITYRRAYRTNQELTAIKQQLEQRVQERTATLDESNSKLKESNQLLEAEVTRHVITSEQLRSSESYIKDILTSMPLMLVTLDEDGRVTQWNKRVEELSGVPAEKALGKTLWEAYPTMTVVPEHITQAIEQNKTIHLQQSLRSMAHFDITIYPLQGPKAGVVNMVDDVSMQTAAQNMLIHNDKMSFMGELASTMAHDINIPLQAILMDLKRFSGIMQDSTTEAEQGAQDQRLSSIVQDMSDKGDQVSKIIHNLLTFARSRHEEKQLADIVDVLKHTVSLGKEVISVDDGLMFKQVRLEWHIEDNLPQAPCYIAELQQVFLSLFRHACLAMQRKIAKAEIFKPTIKVILSESYDNLWIKIQHNGIGLTSDEQQGLFEPFFSDNPQSEDFDAGQHLSFSYYIVTEQHQGHMAVTSDPALGSTFHIQLPIKH